MLTRAPSGRRRARRELSRTLPEGASPRACIHLPRRRVTLVCRSSALGPGGHDLESLGDIDSHLLFMVTFI
jgi:hypothetical protein